MKKSHSVHGSSVRTVKLIWYYFVLPCHSPPTNSEGCQAMTQATTTQEELTQEERPCSAEVDNNGQIHSVLPIIKSPSPDVYGHYPPAEPEPLGQKKTGLQRYNVACVSPTWVGWGSN